MARAVNVRLKLNAFVADATKPREAEDLEPAAVREYRPAPRNETMKPAELIDGQVPRPQIEMISIAENDSRPGIFEHSLRERFDRALSADRHEDGCIERAMTCGDAARASERPSVA